eukprot:1439474-Lingulodinium_polyedra.AAC.1
MRGSCSGNCPAGGGAAVTGTGTAVPGRGTPMVTSTPAKALRTSSRACGGRRLKAAGVQHANLGPLL